MEVDSENPQNPSLETGSSIKGQLCFKLKFPIPTDAGNDAVVDDTQKKDHDQQLRICNVCNKGFSSGKALGGHMRVHVQDLKNRDHFKNSKPKNRENPNVENYEKPTCSICSKTFPSMKSLFGHMRCHPDRHYRGIHPPPPQSAVVPVRGIHPPPPSAAETAAEKSYSSSVSDEGGEDEVGIGGSRLLVTDLVESLPRWSVLTAKRGRKMAELTEEEAHAVHHLMSLAAGDSLESGLTAAKKSVEDHFQSTENDDVSDSTESGQLMVNSGKKKRKKLKLSDLEPGIAAEEDSGNNKYKCSTCNKCFQTHQALGGHRSSHYKANNKTCLAIDQDYYSCSVVGADQEELQAKPVSRADEGAGSSKPADGNSILHQCKICSKVFNTGQALGGHKRCHWSGGSPSQAASPGEASHTGRKILGFDLNELPPMEDEDGIESEHGGGYGYYASSSYNSSLA